MLGERVQSANADLSTELGPTAPPKVPLVPVIKSISGPGGEDKEHAKKLENGSSNGAVTPLNGRENGRVLKPSSEGTNGGGGNNGKPTTDLKTSLEGGGHNGKPTNDLKTSPEGGSGPNGKPDGRAT
ncbi:unnamed protein product [Prunus armeniaca]|uniref:Uncharacterized protein n=1 Tax=Prunus armeniaca TaxID=36596 RepID=A0A6J5XEA2_PRUAR|nr:unnamed protein product [Prunus armeniaca]